MTTDLKELQDKALAELASTTDVKALEAWRIRYLGKKSQLTLVLRGLGALPQEERRQVGAQANELKALLETRFEDKRSRQDLIKRIDDALARLDDEKSRQNLIRRIDDFMARYERLSKSEPTEVDPTEQRKRLILRIDEFLRRHEQEAKQLSNIVGAEERQFFDITLPGRPITLGHLHPTTQILREICDIFRGMGFQVVEGPEVEWDYYNFEALNIPEGHPARDMWATFWVDYTTETGQRPMLLRTHTSPMQIRIMEKTRPPVRVIVPGRVYRYEATDATHESMFHQVEGLAVDTNITMADLKGTLYEFARRLFGRDRKVRFRCDYFPFVEPGVEMAIDCWVCKGEGCRLCGQTGWIEILGAGMVHPEVLAGVGYDPGKYTGFAFGLGVERMPMLKYGIDDIRLFYSNDLRFLRQF